MSNRHQNLRDPKFESGLLVVGKDVPRTDAQPKVTGASQYVADLHMPGMLYAAVLRSPHANARILSIDTSAARAMRSIEPGISGVEVVSSLKSADFSTIARHRPSRGRSSRIAAR